MRIGDNLTVAQHGYYGSEAMIHCELCALAACLLCFYNKRDSRRMKQADTCEWQLATSLNCKTCHSKGFICALCCYILCDNLHRLTQTYGCIQQRLVISLGPMPLTFGKCELLLECRGMIASELRLLTPRCRLSRAALAPLTNCPGCCCCMLPSIGCMKHYQCILSVAMQD